MTRNTDPAEADTITAANGRVAALARREPAEGDVVAGRFVLEHEVRRGGMGSIFRALDRHNDGRPVAIKFMRTDTASAERFLHEAEVLATFDHAHVVRHVAHGQTEAGALYLAMEWLDGVDLAERLRAGPLAVDEVRSLGVRIANTLAVAHARGVIHRDLKPSNLFLPDSDLARVKLLDFGLARVTGVREQALTGSGIVVGTPAYMAPEQARGTRDIDARADLFSLGCVLFECLTARRPFVAENVLALFAKLALEDAPRARSLCGDVPEALDALIASLLAKARDERPASAEQVARTLAAMGGGGDAPVRGPVLTAGEQHRLFVILAPRPGVSVSSAAASFAIATPSSDPELRTLIDLGAMRGVELVQLADGALVGAVVATGDAIDPARRAARCALEIAEAGKRAVAVATGLGSFQAGLPMGEVIDRAALLLAGRSEGAVVDASTAQLVRDRFELSALDASGSRLALGGEITEDSPPLLLGKPAPFVGRVREIGTILMLLDEAIAEHVPRVVRVVAPAGLGKTRLAREAIARAKQRYPDLCVAASTGDSARRGRPLAFARQLIASLTGVVAVGERDGRENPQLAPESAVRLSAVLGERMLPNEYDQALPYVRELLGAPVATDREDVRIARADPAVMLQRIARSVEAMLHAWSTSAPLALVLEDLHWADDTSLELIAAALRRIEAGALCAIMLTRPEGLRGEADERTQDLWLGALSPRASAEMVRKALGTELEATDVDRLVARATGHPFFLEELIRTFARDDDESVPDTVLAMLQARLAQLPAHDRRVLRAASILGESFGLGAIGALIGGGTQAETAAAILRLEAAEILAPGRDSASSGEHELAFRHALWREAAYGSLTDNDRALGHRLAADLLEGAGEPSAIAIADHLDRGGLRERAIAKYQLAVKQAYRASDMVGAIVAAERGLALEPAPEIVRDLHVRASSAYWVRGDLAAAIRSGQAALDLTNEFSPEWYRAVRSVFTGLVHSGNQARWRPIVAQLAEAELTPGNLVEHLRTLPMVAMELLHVGELPMSDRFTAMLQESMATVGDHGIAAVAGVRAWRSLYVGELATAYDDAAQAIRLLERAGLQRDAAFPQFAWSNAAVRLGQTEEALRVLSTAEFWPPIPLFRAPALAVEAVARSFRGEHREARRAADSAFAAAAGSDDQVRAFTSIQQARAAMDMSALVDAERSIERAHVHARDLPPWRAQALVHEAQLHLLRDDPDCAVARLDEARAIDTLIGGTWAFDARADLVRVLALRRLGRNAEADVALAAALAELEQRAASIDTRELRAGFVDRVPVHAALRAGAMDASSLGGNR